MTCPLCSKTSHQRPLDVTGTYECGHCGAVHGQCYLGDSYHLVRPYFTDDRSADKRQRYFDLMTVGSKGLGRRHGWFDPETRLLTQVG